MRILSFVNVSKFFLGYNSTIFSKKIGGKRWISTILIKFKPVASIELKNCILNKKINNKYHVYVVLTENILEHFYYKIEYFDKYNRLEICFN